jgi:quaternary ammonium compound-resistance protein SugE
MSAGGSWLAVLLAGLLEVGFAIGLKASTGFSRPWVAMGTLAALIGSLLLLSMALKQLPVGTAYAVWTGVGAAGTALIGMALFGDPATGVRLGCIGLIVAGVIGLRLVA